MADPITDSLLKEAGVSRSRGNPKPISFTPEEEASNAANVRSPEARAELEKELSNPKLHPVARRALQQEFDTNFGPNAQPAPAPQQPEPPQATDPITFALRAEAKKVADNQVPGSEKNYAQSQPEIGAVEKYLTGPAEAALTMGTGAVGQVVGNVAGIAKGLFGGKYGTKEGANEASRFAQEVAESLTYQPRTEGGKNALETVGQAFEASKLAGLGPAEGVALANVGATAPKAAQVAKATQPAERAVAPGGRMGSVGAQGADIASQAKATAASASHELQAQVAKVADKMDARGLKTLERHVDADTLPVPVRLTRGQAVQDPALISNEQNLRGAKKQYADRFNEQNKSLVENTNAIRENAAPDIFVRTKPELGEIVIDAYKAKDAKLASEVSAKYQALKDANGGDFPLDAKAFANAADKALHDKLLYDHTPKGIRATIERLKDGGSMTFENFESMRTNLARIQRSQADGNEKAAAGVIRKALEDFPLSTTGNAEEFAYVLKPLADQARAAAKARFDLIEADPAYKAVVRGKTSADKFLDKHVNKADTKHVETMLKNLDHAPVAQQAMRAGLVDDLRAAARIVGDDSNFAPAGYNKELARLQPKLRIVMEAPERQALEKLGRVAGYVKGQPAGSFVNNSNTLTGALASGLASTAEGAANMAAKGVPVGTGARKLSSFLKERRETRESLESGAGLRLKEVK